jgi:endonuclease YncB( thermonuclease family)
MTAGMKIRSALAAIALTWLALAISTAGAADFQGKVIGVSDGDTISVLRNGHPERVRLNGIDAPEAHQPFGNRAKQFTSGLAFGHVVTVRPRTIDRYGRTVADVLLPDGRSLSREIVRAGFAWWYRRYSDDRELATLEAEARAARRGLWVDPDPVPPWEWRQAARAGR